jgi:hypothetical protein
MWKIQRRDDQRGGQWSALGMVDSIHAGAARILELEGGRNGALFFRVYVDVWDEEGSDAKALSRLEYQAPDAFYLLTREQS